MAQISRYPISKEVYQRCWEVFVKTLIDIHNSQDAQQIIEDLLTPTERIMLVKRLAIALLLEKGYEYREIGRILKVSFPTVALVSKSLKYGSDGYKKAVTKIIQNEKLWEFFNQAAQKFVELPSKNGMGSGSWRYLKQELQKSSQDKKPF